MFLTTGALPSFGEWSVHLRFGPGQNILRLIIFVINFIEFDFQLLLTLDVYYIVSYWQITESRTLKYRIKANC